MSTRIMGLILMSTTLVGCASPQAKVPVQSVSIKSDSFCQVMRRLHPPHGVPTWDIAVDSPETVDYARKLEAVVVKKCLASQPKSTS